jgi:hypothetical protein
MAVQSWNVGLSMLRGVLGNNAVLDVVVCSQLFTLEVTGSNMVTFLKRKLVLK